MTDEMAQAFAATLGLPAEEPAAEIPVEQAEPTPATETTPVEAGTTELSAEEQTVADSFRGFDPLILETLTPELRDAVERERKSIQGEATRKFQEAAQIRKQYEGIDPEIARNAVTYMERLSDPEFLVEARDAMTDELKKLGLTQAEAEVVVDNTPDEQLYDADTEIDPRILSELTDLRNFKSEYQQDKAAKAEAERLEFLTNQTLKEENAVRKAYPDWDENDITTVLNLGVATGSLEVAAKQYEGILNHAASRILASKASIPSAVSPPANGGGLSVDAAPKPKSLDEGHAMAMEKLKHLLAN